MKNIFSNIILLIILATILISCRLKNDKQDLQSENIIKLPTKEFHKIKPDTLVGTLYPDFEIEEAYILNGNKYLFGAFTNELISADYRKFGPRLIILNSENKLIHKFNGLGDMPSLTPTFFKLNSENTFVIMGFIFDEKSLENIVYLIDNNSFKELGIIELSTNDEPNIAEYTNVNKVGDDIEFSFSIDTLIHEDDEYGLEILSNKGTMYLYKTDIDSLVLFKKTF